MPGQKRQFLLLEFQQDADLLLQGQRRPFPVPTGLGLEAVSRVRREGLRHRQGDCGVDHARQPGDAYSPSPDWLVAEDVHLMKGQERLLLAAEVTDIHTGINAPLLQQILLKTGHH